MPVPALPQPLAVYDTANSATTALSIGPLRGADGSHSDPQLVGIAWWGCYVLPHVLQALQQAFGLVLSCEIVFVVVFISLKRRSRSRR